MPIPEIHNFRFKSTQNSHFIVSPLHQAQQTYDEAYHHADNYCIQQCFLVLRLLRIADMDVKICSHFAQFVKIPFADYIVVFVFAGGDVGGDG